MPDGRATPARPGYRRPGGHPSTAWRVPDKKNAMSLSDKAKNKAEEAAGRATDDELKAEGKTDHAKGNLKQAGKKIKDAFK
jgi:uncharacterized protein YjbJ (UPF0337 family)